MSKNRDEESLVDIYNAGTDIIIFTGGVDKQDFQSDKEKLNATLYSIQIIGEATKRLSAEFRQTMNRVCQIFLGCWRSGPAIVPMLVRQTKTNHRTRTILTTAIYSYHF